jgi:hypothetical protein
MTLEALMNFNVHAAFIGEKLDGMALLNHPNNAFCQD